LYIKIIEGDFVHARANATRKYDACSDAMAVADALQTHLMRRLIRMKKERIQVVQFRDHEVWQFTLQNIPVVAAIAAMSGHFVGLADLKTSTDHDCLLKTDTTCFVKIVGEVGKMHGAYMYYDRRRGRWRRVGKASGDGQDACFQGRHKGHENALKATKESEFCHAFPHQDHVNSAFRA
jgi:hypothetical protein